MFGLGLPELLIILVIIIVIFGAGRIGRLGGELGSGIRAFREGLSGEGEEAKKDTEANQDGQDSAS